MTESIRGVPTLRVFDAAYCPDPVPEDYAGCLVYIGGSSADHIWTDTELARVKAYRRLCTWVPTPGSDNPRQVARQAVRRLHELGVPRGYDGYGRHPAVLWDMETGQEPDPRWLNIAADYVWQAGYANLVYGSLDTIYGQPTRSGYVVAHYDGNPELPDHPGVIAKQYAADVHTPGGPIDQSAFLTTAFGHFWQPA